MECLISLARYCCRRLRSHCCCCCRRCCRILSHFHFSTRSLRSTCRLISDLCWQYEFGVLRTALYRLFTSVRSPVSRTYERFILHGSRYRNLVCITRQSGVVAFLATKLLVVILWVYPPPQTNALNRSTPCHCENVTNNLRYFGNNTRCAVSFCVIHSH